MESSEGAKAAAGLIVLIVLALLYFAPALVAFSRRHRNAAAIFVLNLLGGWTAVGWVIAAVWAFTSNTTEKR